MQRFLNRLMLVLCSACSSTEKRPGEGGEETTGEALDRWIPEASDTWQWQLQIEEGSVLNTT